MLSSYTGFLWTLFQTGDHSLFHRPGGLSARELGCRSVLPQAITHSPMDRRSRQAPSGKFRSDKLPTLPSLVQLHRTSAWRSDTTHQHLPRPLVKTCGSCPRTFPSKWITVSWHPGILACLRLLTLLIRGWLDSNSHLPISYTLLSPPAVAPPSPLPVDGHPVYSVHWVVQSSGISFPTA